MGQGSFLNQKCGRTGKAKKSVFPSRKGNVCNRRNPAIEQAETVSRGAASVDAAALCRV